MIAKIFKRFSLMGIFLALICFAGCLGGTQNAQKSATDFVGSYTSIYENGKGDLYTVFDLEVKEDETFTLKGNGKDVSGTWKSKTVNGDVQLICFSEEENTRCEFTLTMLDDGTVMAESEVLEYGRNGSLYFPSFTYYFSVFGASKVNDDNYYYITTVVFEKK